MSFLNHADDAVSVAPQFHQVVFENEKIRVLNVVVSPGQKAAMHWHPENINYFLQGGKMKFTNQDGVSREMEFAVGQTTSGKETMHAVENCGDTEVRTLQIEFKP